ncbi:MAG: YraN family protein [Gammaproteobacteria bacterium]|nr:YraN family protein [Gammaproteobacteria bacterium]
MQIVGKNVENLACDYLQQQGLKLVTANYSCQLGEIDLIMGDKDVLVFIEVRYRKNINYGDGAATVNKSKQDKLKKTAAYYLQKQNLYDKVVCRFDVVAVSGKYMDKLDWIKDAFWGNW